MAEYLKADVIPLFLIFAVPGLVLLFVRAQLIHGRLPPLSEAGIGYLAISAAYQGFIHPVSGGVLSQESPNALLWLFFIFILPAAIGLLSGISARQNWVHRLLAKAGLNSVHPIACAWDWRFGDCAEGYIMVTLKDDTKWAGKFGAESFSSSTPTERDIYIQQVYDWHEDKPWTPKNSSVWLQGSEIKSIEFWPKG